MKGTDMKGHLYVSLIKSGTRILAGLALFQMNFEAAGAFLILAEVLGVTEEFV